jgi:hypothetical protein
VNVSSCRTVSGVSQSIDPLSNVLEDSLRWVGFDLGIGRLEKREGEEVLSNPDRDFEGVDIVGDYRPRKWLDRLYNLKSWRLEPGIYEAVGG